jgi:hypothetical protein
MTGIPGFANKWYYNTESGQLENTSQALAVTSNLGLAGWHELNIPGSDTGVQAAAAAKAEFPKGATPSYAPVTPAKVAQGAAGEAGVPLTGINAIGALANDLTTQNLWIRVLKIVVGGSMLLLAIARMMGADKALGDAVRLGAW